MEEFRVGRFFRREIELERSPVGRAFWRQVRSGYGRSLSESSPRGPYETSYDVSHGYMSDEQAV